MSNGTSFSEATDQHLEAAIARSQARTAHLRSLRDKNLRHAEVSCKFCRAEHQIGTLIYLQTHWYVPPSGCTEGAYYRQGEGNWDCPACGRRNRLFDKPEITALKHLFVSKRDCYCSDFSMCSDPNPCPDCKKVGATKYGMPDPRGRTA